MLSLRESSTDRALRTWNQCVNSATKQLEGNEALAIMFAVGFDQGISYRLDDIQKVALATLIGFGLIAIGFSKWIGPNQKKNISLIVETTAGYGWGVMLGQASQFLLKHFPL